jgi:hypothetical protein
MGHYFKIIGHIDDIEIIATGRGIRELSRLKKVYGGHRWRKMKGIALVRLSDGNVTKAEIHWYEADGIGKIEHKIKRFL